LAELTYTRADNAPGYCGMSTKLPEESPRGITVHRSAKTKGMSVFATIVYGEVNHNGQFAA